MKVVRPGEVEGVCAAPPSKSAALRALAAASLSDGESTLLRVPHCDDVVAGRRVLEDLGAVVREAPGGLAVRGSARPAAARLDCGESALCLRIAAALAARRAGRFELTGRGSLLRRPLAPVVEALESFGARARFERGGLPLTIDGPLVAGQAALDGAVTSQALTGLLLALPTCQGDSRIEVRGLASRPYVAMTLRTLATFGVDVSAAPDFSRFEIPGRQAYRAARLEIDGDWSAAAFLLVAGALAGRVTVTGLGLDSPQADRAVLEVLGRAGARVRAGPTEVTVARDRLEAFQADLSDCPDLLPPLVALACHARGTTVLRGTGRTRHKESDRPAALARELGWLGARIRVGADAVEVTGHRLDGGEVDASGDHRIAMALAVAALAAEGAVAVRGAQCVSKSYPGFFDDLDGLRSTK